MNEVKGFCTKYGITENQFYGIDKIEGNLYLDNLTELIPGFNPTVGGYLDLSSLKELLPGFNPTVGGSLDLSSITELLPGFNPTVGGNLYLNRVTSLIEGFNPTVGGNLNLYNLTKLLPGFNPTVGGNLYLYSLTELIPGFNPTVGGNLNLYNLTKLIPGFNPTVGGYLYLYSITELLPGFNPTVGGNLYLPSITELIPGFNPTVGGSLDLSSITELIPGFNPTVGGNLWLNNLKCDYTKLPKDSIISWENGKYIKVDGIFCEVITKKKNLFKCKYINTNKEFYIVSDGRRYSHGNTIKQAKADLIYKISNRDTSRYNNLTLDSILTFEECVECYMIITGSCSFGTKDFVLNRLNEKKGKYSIREIIEGTEGEYGNEIFKKFFNK